MPFAKPNIQIKPIKECRMVSYKDLDHLSSLMNDKIISFFGADDIRTIFFNCYVGLVAENSEKEIVSGMFFNNFPNLPSIPPWDWESWIKNIYHLQDTNSTNTLFVHLAMYNVNYEKEFVKSLLKQLFDKCLRTKYVIIIVPPYKKLIGLLYAKMYEVSPRRTDASHPQKLIMYVRQNFVKTYKIRRAVIEDNDDLIPMIDLHSKRLRKNYGDYYIAEIVSDKNSKRHAIVSEYNQNAAGVILFNEDINLVILNGYFHLECFYGLTKPSLQDKREERLSSSVFNKKKSQSSLLTPCDSIELIQMDFQPRKSLQSSIKTRLSPSKSFHSLNEEEEHELTVPCHEEDVSTSTSTSPFCDFSTVDMKHKFQKSEVFKGVIEGKYSCYLLHFTEEEVKQWKDLDSNQESLHSILTSLLSDLRKYNGESNAFTLEVLAAWPEHEECHKDLLQVGFELFPDKDYCVLCMPSDVPYFRLLTKIFVRISPLPMSNFPHELYVVHKNSLYCSVTLRRGKPHDEDHVYHLLRRLKSAESTYRTFVRNLTSPTDDVQSYVILCDKEIVGVVNLEDLKNKEYILGRYQLSRMTDLSRHKPGSFGRIKHFVMSPIFQRHGRLLLMELHRLSDYSLLIYIVNPEDTQSMYREKIICSVLNELIPVLPAKVPEFSKEDNEDIGWEIPDVMQKVDRPFAVYLSTLRYVGLPRFEIKRKIVVVGASEVGLSFLLSLVFNHNPLLHTIFNNITLVSTQGIPHYKSNRWEEIMLPMTSEMTSGYYLAMVSLGTYVNVVKGVMGEINREKKTITVNSSILPYDMLFLTCGTQFQIPIRPDKQDKEKIECPDNVFVLNTRDDVNLAITKMEEIVEDTTEGKFLIYGNCIETYCCLEGLLEFELPPTEIIFVVPPYSEKSGTFPAFDDKNIEEAIHDQIVSLGVILYKNCIFSTWAFDPTNRRIETITLECYTRTFNLKIKAAFMYDTKKISRRTFQAISKANLIYDGALVISPDFLTNDPNIYAAGRITKYQRKYYADHQRHDYFNQSEIGQSLAQIILKKLLPSGSEFKEEYFDCNDLKGKMLIPRYTKPIMLFAEIPRKIQYLYVRKPGICTPLIFASLEENFGEILITGNCKDLDTQGYFVLHLNQYNTVETIIAINKNTAIERSNLTRLWGKHESLLKNLLSRYKSGLVKDLFLYFARPSLHALYHDRWEWLERNLTKILMQPSIEPGLSVIEDIVDQISQNGIKMLTPEQQDSVMEKFLKSEYHKEMEKMILQYLADNSNYLPMYGTPGALTVAMGTNADSPLFTNI